MAVVVGTRPEIIKMAPVIFELEKRGIDYIFIHTGQHYDYELSTQFISELGLPKPDYFLKLNYNDPPAYISEIMIGLWGIFRTSDPDIVLVEGDTNSVVASALTALKMNIKIGHVEAGLRSFDWRMPEEHNRIIVDHISDVLFAPTEGAKNNLVIENIHGKIFVTGNTIIDSVILYMPVAEKQSKIMEHIKFKEYALMTVHRAENVDNTQVLRNFINLCLKSPIPIVFPIHPRTFKRLKESGLDRALTNSPNVQLFPPLGYFDFLMLMKNCKLILTDSGGLQEEATAPPIRKPVIVLRLSTERPEAVEAGFARVVGVNCEDILKSVYDVLKGKFIPASKSPFGNGKASKKIVDIVSDNILR